MSGLSVDHYRDLLLAEQREAEETLRALGADIDAIVHARQGSNNDDEHDPEGVTLAFERAQTEAMLVQSRNRLLEIGAALTRLGDGTYGACESCGRPIGWERLTARPYASTCIECASAR